MEEAKKDMTLKSACILLFLSSLLFAERMKVTGYGASIEVPAGWVLVNVSEMPVAFQLLSPPENEQDFFQENVTLTVQPLQRGESLKSVRDKGVAEMAATFDSFKMLDESGPEGMSHLFEYTSEGMRFRAKQVVKGFDGKVAILTFTALVATYSRYEMEFSRLMNTFTILEKGK